MKISTSKRIKKPQLESDELTTSYINEFNELSLQDSNLVNNSLINNKEFHGNWEDLINWYSFPEENNFVQKKNTKFNASIDKHKLTNTLNNTEVRYVQEVALAMNNQQLNINTQLLSLTKQKQSKDELNKFIKAVELSPSVVVVMSLSGVIKYANPNFLEISGYNKEEIIGKEFGMLISDLASHDEYEQIIQSIRAGATWKGELVNRKKNGEWYILKTEISPAFDNFGSIIDYLIIGQDITAIKETEIRLEEALDNKRILLSELHHRVKNNLAILSGMMQLQALEEADEELRMKLFSSVGRVKTMANMHELLFESGSFSRLEFGRNIKRIVETVSGMYGVNEKFVNVQYEMDPVLLNINQVHPCSLVINEVITNSYKNSFSNNENPTLQIKLKSIAKKVSIVITDNGKILRDDFTDSKGSEALAYQLVQTLVSQINGTFRYVSNQKKSTFTLEFDRENIRGSLGARLL